MKRQLSELLAACDPEILWFDGEWPDWWTEEDGRDLYAFLRAKKPTSSSTTASARVATGCRG